MEIKSFILNIWFIECSYCFSLALSTLKYFLKVTRNIVANLFSPPSTLSVFLLSSFILFFSFQPLSLSCCFLFISARLSHLWSLSLVCRLSTTPPFIFCFNCHVQTEKCTCIKTAVINWSLTIFKYSTMHLHMETLHRSPLICTNLIF